MEHLVVIEVSQKQNYIFKTNRLAENIGASIHIRDITEEMPKALADEAVQETECGGSWQLVLQGGGKSVYGFSEEKVQTYLLGNLPERF